MKRLHKILLVVLTVSLILGAVAVSAMAQDNTSAVKIGDTEYATLAEALSAANTNAELGANVTITLVGDVTISGDEAVKVTRDGLHLTLDLNGNTLTASAVSGAAFIVDTANTALTVTNGSVLNASGITDVFRISATTATLSIDSVSVFHKGGANAFTVNAMAGKVNVQDSSFETYGVGGSTVRQSGDAAVTVTDSTINSKDGSAATSAAISVAGNSTVVAEAPNVSFVGTSINAANAVIIGAIDPSIRVEGTSYVNTAVSFKNCDIIQANYEKYNDTENLLNANRNAVTVGDYFDTTFDSCNIKFARIAFNVNDSQTVAVKGCYLIMTFDGQRVYINDLGATVDCEAYLAVGTGTVTIDATHVILPHTGDETLATGVKIVNDNTQLVLGRDTTFNVNSNTIANYVAEGLQAIKRGTKAGMYIGTEDDVNYVQVNITFDTLVNTSVVLREPIVCLSKGDINADGSPQSTRNNNRITHVNYPTYLNGTRLMTIQGISSIEVESDGNKYFYYDPTYVYNPYDNNSAKSGFRANLDKNGDGVNECWDLNGDGKPEYEDSNGDGIADKVNISGAETCNTDIPERYTESYHSFQCFIGDYTSYELKDLTYYAVDFDYRTAVGANEFFSLTSLFLHGRTASDGNLSPTASVAIDVNGEFGTGKLSLNSWNHITLLAKVNASNPTESIINYYLDGVCVAQVKSFSSDVGVIKGARAEGTKISLSGRMCVDNVTVTAYGVDYVDENAAALFVGTTSGDVTTYPKLDTWQDSWYMSDERIVLGAVEENNFSIGADSYASFKDAYDAAEPGDTITLNKDVDGLVEIEKPIIINNVLGVKFIHTSSEYKALKTGDLIVFTKATESEIVDVNFHENATDTVNYKVAAGNYVKYLGNSLISGNIIKEDSIVSFKGWGYTASATEYADEYVYIDGTKSTIDYYAVYSGASFKGKTYAVITSSGSVVQSGSDLEDFLINNFESTVGNIVVLFADVELSAPISVTSSGNYYINLNGYTITSAQLFASDCSTIERVYDMRVNVYSTREGGTIDLGASDVGLVNMVSNNKGPNLYFNFGNGYAPGGNHGFNLIIKTGVISNQRTYKTHSNYNGATIYANSNDAFYIGGGYCTVTNSIAINTTPGAGMIYVDKSAKEFTAANSTFIGTPNESGEYANMFSSAGAYTTNDAKGVNLVNCNIYNYKLASNSDRGGAFTANGCSFNVAYEGNNSLETMDNWPTYDVASYVIASGNYKTVVLDGVAYRSTYTFARENATVTVTWDVDGTQTTETYIKGGSAYYPVQEKAGVDGFYTFKLSGYKSNNGVSADNLTADVTLTPIYETVVVDIEVYYSVTITDKLALNIYIPQSDIVKSITLGSNGKNLLDNATVKDGYYYVPYKAISPNQIHRDITYYITIETPVGDVTKAVTVSILDYAKDLLAGNAADAEKALVAGLIAYANEAYKYFDGEENAEVAALLSTYKDLVPTTELTAAKNPSAVVSAVKSVYFELKSQIACVFRIADDFSGTVTINGTDYIVSGGDTIRIALPAYAAIETVTITVNGTSAECDLATYAASLDGNEAEDLVKALYDFANAAAAYVK